MSPRALLFVLPFTLLVTLWGFLGSAVLSGDWSIWIDPVAWGAVVLGIVGGIVICALFIAALERWD